MTGGSRIDCVGAYESKARDFLRLRDQSRIGKHVVETWAGSFERGACVIELACGGGYPVTKTLCSAGLRLYAIDSSATLLGEFRMRFPDIPVQCAEVQQCDFFNRTYDGAVAIGLVFLLTESEQLALIAELARRLRPAGRFLFTAPIEVGVWKDITTGVMCTSLGQSVYENHLKRAGFQSVVTLTDSGGNNYYDARLLP
ncbi:MAG: class I SAM-dependent methyltransferase [Granulosicoccus sp.]